MKNYSTRSFFMILLAAFALSMTGCKKEATEVTGIYFTNIQRGKVELFEGETFRVKYMVEPYELQGSSEILWESSKKSVATVKNGRITAQSVGKAVISATCGSVSAHINVTVEHIDATDFTIPSELDIYVDKQVRVEVTDIQPELSVLSTINWTIEDDKVASYEIEGGVLYVTGNGEGSTVLRGTCGNGVTKTCKLTVTPYIKPESVVLSIGTNKLEFKARTKIYMNISPSNASMTKPEWTITPADLLTFDEAGMTLKAGDKEGTVVIYAVVDGVKSNECEITIVPPEPANCYIITEPGEYSIKPVKGNSDESVGAVAGARVLWEQVRYFASTEPGEMIESASYSDGMIRFTVAEGLTDGNAIVAAVNSSGTILWSWHIWYQPDVIKEYKYPSGEIMMDRDLGAWDGVAKALATGSGYRTTAYNIWGLLYQWGRKDPFSKRFTYENTDGGYIGSIANPDERKTLINASTGTISYTIKNPTRFLYAEDSDQLDWMYNPPAPESENRWSSKSKTIYDPCPSGWMVPPITAWDGLEAEDCDYYNYYNCVVIDYEGIKHYYDQEYGYNNLLNVDNRQSWQTGDIDTEYPGYAHAKRIEYANYWNKIYFTNDATIIAGAYPVRCCREKGD